MNCYETLASSYDALTEDVEYPRRAAYLCRLLRRASGPVRSVLDLACGTGTMTCLLAERGYEMTGVDLSADMLAEAANKALRLPAERRPLFSQQSMTGFRLPAPADAAVCCLDSLNYLTQRRDVRRAFRRVARALRPGGVFVFDVNTEEKLRALDGQVFLDETEDAYCVWRAAYERRSGSIFYGVDLFRRQADGRWCRSFEEHRERAYPTAELTAWLAEAGFREIRIYGDLRLTAPGEQEQRIYYSALRA